MFGTLNCFRGFVDTTDNPQWLIRPVLYIICYCVMTVSFLTAEFAHLGKRATGSRCCTFWLCALLYVVPAHFLPFIWTLLIYCLLNTIETINLICFQSFKSNNDTAVFKLFKTICWILGLKDWCFTLYHVRNNMM